MNINKININQSEPTYYIASDIYDVSAHNNGTVFESLSALLSDSNLSTLIPSAVRCGGMTIRFLQSSDNKYVQYRLMANVWSTTVDDWQGVDDEPTEGSNNLVKSGGVEKRLKWLDIKVLPLRPTWRIIDVCQECDLGDGTTGQAVKLSLEVGAAFKFHRTNGSREGVTIANSNQRIFPITDDISINSEVVLYYDSSDQ